ncbi:MAG: metalloregulator ArsR/SmtB family transcription factor [Acidimicrobiales bacterium]
MTDRPRGLHDLDRIDAVFSALAHPTRRQILTVLRARGGTMTSGELASRFECSWPTTTGHLGVLADADLVTIEKHGRERHYRLDTDELVGVAGQWLERFAASPPECAGT